MRPEDWTQEALDAVNEFHQLVLWLRAEIRRKHSDEYSSPRVKEIIKIHNELTFGHSGFFIELSDPGCQCKANEARSGGTRTTVLVVRQRPELTATCRHCGRIHHG